MQIRENAVRESVQNGFLQTKHCPGKYNLADMFTKEDKDNKHLFIEVRDHKLADKLRNFNLNNNEITARRALSVSYASTTLLHVSEGGVSTYVQTDTVE